MPRTAERGGANPDAAGPFVRTKGARETAVEEHLAVSLGERRAGRADRTAGIADFHDVAFVEDDEGVAIDEVNTAPDLAVVLATMLGEIAPLVAASAEALLVDDPPRFVTTTS